MGLNIPVWEIRFPPSNLDPMKQQVEPSGKAQYFQISNQESLIQTE